jgi:hypothetical protein
VNEGDLGSIPFGVEHALAEESPIEAHAIEAADEAVVPIDLHRVAVTGIEEFAVQFADAPADPGLLPVHAGGGAASDNPVEILVDPYLELVRADRAGQALGDVKIVERNDPPFTRLDPEERGVVRVFRHGKDASRISFQQDVGGNLDRVVGRPGHSLTYPIIRAILHKIG